MTTINGTINNGIEFGIAYPSPLTITSTGYIKAGTNGYQGAAVYGAAGSSLYLNNQGCIVITQIGASGVEDAVNSGFSLNNSGTITGTGIGGYEIAGGDENITNTGSGVIGISGGGISSSGILVLNNAGTITGDGTVTVLATAGDAHVDV